jgi:hypothetical protein
MILSVSRRTDIPAFYGGWLINRLRQGYAYVRNPLNYAQVSRVALSAGNVDCIVFWTKDAGNFMRYLDEIDGIGYAYYFQFTVTPYGDDIEPSVRPKAEVIETFKRLSERIGRERVVFRYDPVLLTGKYDIDYHVESFRRICGALHRHTERAVISFMDGYKKISKNMNALGVKEITADDMLTIAGRFAETASSFGLRLETCAEHIDLSKFGIGHASCIDGDLIERIIGCPIKGKHIKDANREHCGCMKSIDIGQYDSCIHGCLYCYANINKERAAHNFNSHDPASPILLGEADEAEVKPRSEKDTRSLKIN